MKINFWLTALVINLGLAGSALAAVDNSIPVKNILDRSPVYVLVKMQASEGDLKGYLQAVGGKMSLAKEIGISSAEVLNNAENDLGTPTDQINFELDGDDEKGMVIRLLPEDNSGKLIINRTNWYDGKFEVNYLDLYNEGWFIRSENDFMFSMEVIKFPENFSLSQRNNGFSNKLQVAPRLVNVEIWANAKEQNGEISAELQDKFAELSDQSWFKNYSDEDVRYFNWRFNRLKKNINDKKVSPTLFYGGLNTLMKRFK